MLPIITIRESEKIINAKEEVIEISLDLGLSLARINLKDGFVFIEKNKVPLKDFEKLKENNCYIIEENQIKKVAFFSDETNLYYSLFPTKDWPTVKISSTPMHRHINISPKEDTISKIKEISPVKGRVLDTCCGLGYTAIMSSKYAEEVYTFEIDKNMLHIASFNPYSEELFSNKKIKIFEEDVFEGINKLKDNFFDRIIHDPPTFKYASEIYSGEFYKHLFRVLKHNGILYHYAPWPQKTKNKVFYKGIIRRLQEAGFKNVIYSPKSSGIRAYKP